MLFRLTLVAATAVSGLAIAAVPNKYEITELPRLCDSTDASRCGANSFAFGINNSGVVVGHSQGPFVPDTGDSDGDGNTTEELQAFVAHGFRWEAGAITDLQHLGKNESYATAINTQGEIVGRSNKVTAVDGANETIQYRAFRLPLAGTMTDIGVPAQVTATVSATDIDDDGNIVGYALSQVISGSNTYYTRGFVWSPTSNTVTLIPALQEQTESVLRATKVNLAGGSTAVGYSVKDGSRQAIQVSLSTPGTLVEVSDLGGLNSEANDVDQLGRVVGLSQTADNATFEGFLYDPSQATVRSLGQLATTSRFSQANAINANGFIVGTALDARNVRYRAAIFDSADSTAAWVDLNTRIECAADPADRWQLVDAVAVNDSGQIVGYGSKGTELRAFLLTPVVGGALPAACPAEPEFKNNSGGGAFVVLFMPLLYVLRRHRHQR